MTLENMKNIVSKSCSKNLKAHPKIENKRLIEIVSYKSFVQKFPTKVLYTSFVQKFRTKLRCKILSPKNYSRKWSLQIEVEFFAVLRAKFKMWLIIHGITVWSHIFSCFVLFGGFYLLCKKTNKGFLSLSSVYLD